MAAELWDYMRLKNKLMSIYSLSCSRQHTNRRKLLQEDHSDLVAGLTGLVEQKNKERQLSWMLSR
jgi:hypothetical protein